MGILLPPPQLPPQGSGPSMRFPVMPPFRYDDDTARQFAAIVIWVVSQFKGGAWLEPSQCKSMAEALIPKETKE